MCHLIGPATRGPIRNVVVVIDFPTLKLEVGTGTRPHLLPHLLSRLLSQQIKPSGIVLPTGQYSRPKRHTR